MWKPGQSSCARQEQPPHPRLCLILGGIFQLSQGIPAQAEGLLWLLGCVIKGHVRNVPEPGRTRRRPRELLTTAQLIAFHPLTLPMFFSTNMDLFCVLTVAPAPPRADSPSGEGGAAFTHSLISAGCVSSSSPITMTPFNFTLPVNLPRHAERASHLCPLPVTPSATFPGEEQALPAARTVPEALRDGTHGMLKSSSSSSSLSTNWEREEQVRGVQGVVGEHRGQRGECGDSWRDHPSGVQGDPQHLAHRIPEYLGLEGASGDHPEDGRVTWSR